jgi:hypothetical protein
VPKEQPLITFVSTLPGLTQIEECNPKPMNKYIPDWWKKTPVKKGYTGTKDSYEGNIKTCPSFVDFFSKGYVIPMWADVLLSFDKSTDRWEYRTRSNQTQWGALGKEETIGAMPYKLLGSTPSFAFKAYSPWKIITKPGYSCMLLPLFFHFNADFSVIPGIVDTDTHHSLHPDVLYHTDKTEIIIERGTPLMHVIPFERENPSFAVQELEDIDVNVFKKINEHSARMETKFQGTNNYLNDRKLRSLRKDFIQDGENV